MRDHKERFSTFPFSAICISQSSVEVVENQPKKLQAISSPTPTNKQLSPPLAGEIPSERRSKSSFLPLHKVFKSFKSLSDMFQSYKEEEDDDEEIEMVIGLPTDVQHVAHIGWDGSNSRDKCQELLYPPAISTKQFELAMAASQAH